MSKGWKTFLLAAFVLIMGAALFSTSRTFELQEQYRAVVEENKALKAVNQAAAGSQKNDSLKYSHYPELMAHAVITFKEEKETYRPVFWIKLGRYGSYEDMMTVYSPQQGSRPLLWKKEVFDPVGIKSAKTVVTSAELPGVFPQLKQAELRQILAIVMRDDDNYLLVPKNDTNFERAFKLWQTLALLYPGYSAGY